MGALSGEREGRALLELREVRREYGERTVVRSATSAVGAGECVALDGDNGPGKSTLLLGAAFVRPHGPLILDEPEQRLDARARAELVRALAAHRDRGAAVLVVTHHPGISALADRAYRLSDGLLEPCADGRAGGERRAAPAAG
jgi:ABC-type sugar transport system ATPase subunit